MDETRPNRVVADLSHELSDGLPAYPGLPPARIGLYLDHAASRGRYEGQAEFAIGQLTFVGNTGTYLDAPYHRYRDGVDIAGIPLGRLVDLATVVIDVTQAASDSRRLEVILPPTPLTGRAVLFRTDRSRLWGSDAYFEPGPYLGPTAIDQLVHRRPAVVGVDFSNIDDPDDVSRPAHTRLLGEGIVVVEHLRNLDRLPVDARSSYVPLAVVGAPSMPIRAFATWPEPHGR